MKNLFVCLILLLASTQISNAQNIVPVKVKSTELLSSESLTEAFKYRNLNISDYLIKTNALLISEDYGNIERYSDKNTWNALARYKDTAPDLIREGYERDRYSAYGLQTQHGVSLQTFVGFKPKEGGLLIKQYYFNNSQFVRRMTGFLLGDYRRGKNVAFNIVLR